MNLEEAFNFYKGKKVPVTGHTGFKGTWLSRILCKRGGGGHRIFLKPADRPGTVQHGRS